jgi:hypothetical protein
LSFEYTGSCNVIYPRNKLWANSYIWSTRIWSTFWEFDRYF